MKTKLDAAVVAAAECTPRQRRIDLYCSVVTGLMLTVTRSGCKTYFVRYSNDFGKQKQITLGRADRISFDQARKAARKVLAEAALGSDPAAKKAERKATPRFAELACQVLADAKLHQRSYVTTEMYFRRHIIPRWGKVPVSEIDSRAVAQWLADKRAEGLAPATAIKLKALLGRAFTLGARWGIPGCDRNPARGIQSKPLNNARERFLSAEEAARLRQTVAASKNRQLGPIVDLLLYTGARLRELLDARWEHVDVERRSWFIPRSKTGKTRHVPLSTAALEVIARLPRFEGCPWLVPNPETLKPFVSIKHGWQAARDAAGLEGLRLHDCRHAFASFAVASGVDLFAVGKVLGHASYQSTQRYSHLANDTLLAAVEAGASKQKIASAA